MPSVRAAGAEQQEAAAEGAAAAAGGGAVLGVTDALCELKFRVSPTAFYQVGASAVSLAQQWGCVALLIMCSYPHVIS